MHIKNKFVSLLLFFSLLISILNINVQNVSADTQSYTLTSSDFSITAAFGSGIYSRASSVNINKTISLSNVQTASLTVGSTVLSCSVTTNTVVCSGAVSGTAYTVHGVNHAPVSNAGFYWDRNDAGGAHSYWWSADLLGDTQYAINGIGGCGVAPCSDPGTSSTTWPVFGYYLDASGDTFVNAPDSVAYSVITGNFWLQSLGGKLTNVDIGPISGGISSLNSFTAGPFGSTGAACGNSPYTCMYPFSFGAILYGTTYGYDTTATLNYTLNGQPTPSPTATPTATPLGATPTPTPVPTPTPAPTCSTPVFINAIMPSTAKAGSNLFVSGSGSKDSSGGTNLSYQWYYWENLSGGGNGPVVTGPSTRDAQLNIPAQGNYHIILGITDLSKPICSAQTGNSITITPPGPDADVTVQGALKINRPLVIDGSNSSSPSSYPIVDSSRTFSITPLNGAAASDIVTLQSLNGTTKVDTMLRKPGNYQVSYTVTNSLGLSNIKSITITIADDFSPTGLIQGSLNYFRDPINNNMAHIALTAEIDSPDGDAIGSGSAKVVFDKNNDGNFADNLATDTIPSTFNIVTNKLDFDASSVGKYLVIISGCETFNSGPFASYLTIADYKCSTPAATSIINVDNQAPITSLIAQKNYKTDIVLNIGDLSTTDQNYFMNNISGWKTTLSAKGIDANFTVGQWNKNIEPDFLKDSNALLNNQSWRNPLDQKYYIGVTKTVTNNIGSGVSSVPLDLKPIPVSNTPFEGTIISAKATGRNVYLTYQYPFNGTSNYYLYYASGTAGTALSRSNLGYQYNSSNAYPYNSYASLDLDFNGNPNIIVTHDPDSQNNMFFHQYYLFAPNQGAWNTPLTGIGSGNLQYNQIFSKMSNMSSGPTLWSTSGIFYINTWQQNGNYFRKPSNSWNPTGYPDYYDGNAYDIYTAGFYSGGDYWFGSTGNSNTNYLFLSYNGTRSYYPNYNYYFNYGYASGGNSVTIFVSGKSDGKLYKLTFTNGILVSQVKLINAPTNMGIVKGNSQSGKLYYSSYNHIVAEYDFINDKVIWTKSVPSDYTIQDISFDSDGVTPLYLFSSFLTNMYYLSKDGDTTATVNDTMTSRSAADYSASYNESGTYAWFTLESGQLYQIHKIDPNGLYSHANIPYSYFSPLRYVHVMANNDVIMVGLDTSQGYFYGLESEGYVKHYQKPAGFSTTTITSSSPMQVYADPDDNVAFTMRDTNDRIWGYKIDLAAKTINYTGSLMFQTQSVSGTITDTYQVASTKAINNQFHSIIEHFQSNSSSYTTNISFTADGMAMGAGIAFDAYQWSYYSSSIDVNSSGYFFATAGVSHNSSYIQLFATNLPNYPSSGYFSNLAGCYQVSVKFINNVLYAYCKRAYGNPTEVYRVDSVFSSGSYNFKFVSQGYIQNSTIMPMGWVGHSAYVFTDSYTNLPNAKQDAGIPHSTFNTNFNGYDQILLSSSIKNQTNFTKGTYSRYDNVTGGYSTIRQSPANSNILEAVFYNSANNQYVKNQYNTTGANPSNFYYSNIGYSRGNYYFVILGTGVYGGYQTQTGVTVYKMSKAGTTNLYSYTLPDPSKSIIAASFNQDEQGYTYGYIVTQNYDFSGSSQLYLISNKSGAFKVYAEQSINGYMGYAPPISVNNGNIMFSLAGYSSHTLYYMDTSKLETSSSFKEINLYYLFSSSSMGETDMIYDPVSQNIYFVGLYYYSFNGSTYYQNYISGASTNGPNKFKNYGFSPGTSFVFDSNYIYAVDKTNMYKLNKNDFTLVDVSRPAPTNTSYGYFALNSKGKFVGLTDDGTGKAVITVYNGIDISQNDPSLSTVIGSQSIKALFVGPQAIQPDVNYYVNLSNGQFFDSAPFVNSQQIMDELTNYINTNLKQQASGQTVYYLMGDQLNLQGVYGDYENDPKQADKYKLTHDPSIFDNNQGVILNNGQSQTTPFTLDHVGSYVGTYSAQDNPSLGNAALAPFSKWSAEDSPITFVVHRKPFAVFNTTLRDDPNNAGKVLFSVMESSYDLDHNISDPVNKGIVSKQWMYKDSSSATWINGLPPSSLPANVSYDLVLTVTDLEGATAKANTTLFTGFTTPNHLPVTDITNITSTDSNNPTVLSTLTPNYLWNYTDADGDPQQKYTLNVYNSSNTLLTTSGDVASSAKAYTQATSLSQNVVYSVQVMANDGFGYGALSPKKYFKVVLNHPPTGNLTFTTPIYQHDTPTFAINQSDPDNDALTISVDSSLNGGAYVNIAKWTNAASGVLKTFAYGPLTQGVYSFRLTLDDGKGGVYTQVYSFTALPLTITGAVNHTIDWENNRLQWNQKFPLKLRAPIDFWAGEAFEVTSIVASTGMSATKPQSVSATLLQTGDVIALSSTDNVNFSGEMLNTSFIHSLPDGSYTMRFQIRWTNGLIQTVDVPINIKGNIFDVLVVQNRN